MTTDVPAMKQKHIYPVEALDGVIALPEQMIGMEESARQMLTLLLKLHPGTTIKQTNKTWDEWTAYLPDGRKLWVQERRDFWDECEKCSDPGAGHAGAMPPARSSTSNCSTSIEAKAKSLLSSKMAPNEATDPGPVATRRYAGTEEHVLDNGYRA